MKKILALIAVMTVAAGSAYAGCGKTETTTGKLQSYNAESKSITVAAADGKSVKLTLTPAVKGDVQALVGKNVTVVSEHKKVSSVTGS